MKPIFAVPLRLVPHLGSLVVLVFTFLSVEVIAQNNCASLTYPATVASFPADEDITNVTVGTMNNSSACGFLAPGAGSVAFRYSNYTGSVVGPSAAQGAAVPFSLTMTTCGGAYLNFFQIYIDWNQDSDFADVGERVYSQPAALLGNQTTPLGAFFTVPITALVGTTRMRVVNVEAPILTTNYAQTAYDWGETEDYCFTVTAAVACSGVPSSGSASISTLSGCASSNFDLNATGLSIGPGVSYQWQSSNSATGPWTNIAGATSPSLTTSATTNTFYQLVSTCANSGASSISNVVSYTVNTCPGSITMTDSFSDGWDGATMTLNVNGVPFGVFGPTFTNGGSQTISFCLPAGSSYSLTYTNGGTFPLEVGVSLTIGGGVVYNLAAGGGTVGSILYSGTNCTPPVPPVNDLVCNATSIVCGETLAGTTLAATTTGVNELSACGTPNTQPAVWYKVVGTGQLMRASLCGTAWNSRIRVFSGINCSILNCVGGNNDLGPACAGTSASFQWLSVVGLDYYIAVSGFNSESAFSLNLNCPAITSGCSGTFTDSGGAGNGAGANYGNNQYNTTTFCPNNGGRVTLTFSQFILENGFDYMTIYDGTNTNSPVLGSFTGTELQGLTVGASISNASGCLTVTFDSDGSGTAAGWNASISCVLPCQTIQSVLVSTSPSVQSDGVIRICQGQTVALNGIGNFSVNSANASYTWTFNNGNPINGQNVIQTFNSLGTYIANLDIQDPNGCRNTNRLNVRIEVSTTPLIATSSNPTGLCLGQTANLGASVSPIPNVQSCTPPLLDPTFLPDGAGISYQAPILVDCYNSAQIIQSVADISSICLNMEHSSLGDLDIQIQCPNGSIATLFDNADVGLSPANLGQPVSSGPFDLTLPNPLTPGVGSVYCFSGDVALPTIAQSILAGGSFPDYNGPLANYTDSYVPGGASLTYEASGGLTPLIGCPLNGQWSIIVTDNIRYDNGYIFNWDINFTNAIASSLNFTPTIVSQGWQAASGLTTTAGSSSATVTPTVAGNNCYTYSVTDNFGCTYNHQACVSVISNLTAAVNSASICSGGSATITATPSISGTYNYVWTVPSGAVNPGNVASFNATVAGTYSVVVSTTTTPSCSSPPAVGTLTVGATMTANSAAPNATICLNQALSPNVVFTTTGATGIGAVNLPLGLVATFSGNATAGTITISGTPSSAAASPFAYTIALTGGCGTINAAGTITINPLPTVYAHGTNPTCSTLCNGSAVVDITNGTAPYTVNWSNGGNTASITNLCEGTYNVTVTDANGCVSRAFTPVSGCFQIQAILVDACAPFEGQEEMVFFQVGTSPLTTSSPAPSITWATSNTFQGFCTNQAFINANNALITGGGLLIPVPIGGTIPANANVVLVTSTATTVSSNSFANLTDTLYVMFQCGSTTAGHFSNSNSTGTSDFSMSLGGCTDAVSYSRPALSSDNGAYVIYSQSNTPTYLAYGCTAPYVIQENSVELIAPDPVATTFNPVGPYCSGSTIPDLPTSSTNVPPITGTWTPAISNTTTTPYTFIPTAGLCASSTTLPITITPLNTASAPSSNPTLCLNTVLPVITIATTGATGITDAGVSGANGLPAGVSATWASNTITISGTPTAAGTFNYSILLTGGCGAINATGSITVTAPPNAGNDGSVSVCASGAAVDLFSALGTTVTNGIWSGPSTLSGGNLGTFNPASNITGTYTYTVPGGACPSDAAVVTVTITSSPTATVAYPSPICNSVTSVQLPIILGAAGGAFSSAALTVNASSGGFNPSGVAPGTYTVNYTINITGCSPFQTAASVTIVPAPVVPTLLPANPCALNANTYTAGSGSWYEYFVGGVSTGPASATNTLTPGVLAAGTQVCVRSYPAPTYVFDGAINEPQWGNALATSAGGPVSGFGPNYLDALYLNAGGGYLYGAIAGQTTNNSNNRILLFLDCIAGGFNNLNDWFPRNNAPYYSVENLGINGGIVFDPGFSPDYILCMNQANGTAFWDLYNMTANTNAYLGSDVLDGAISANLLGYQANGSQGNLTQGFEFAIPLSFVGNPTTSIQTFAMLVNDPGIGNATTVSNQFLTPAGTTNGNYGNAFIDFGAAPPNPIAYGLPPLCYQEQCVTVVAPATPTFTDPSAICAGQTAPILPTSSSNSPPVTGTWSGPVSNQASGTYTFTPGAGQCATQKTLNVQVNPVPITVGIFHD